ncbi:MAG: leucine-rich repeat domain-containing protein [Roseburia sp.]|nr:leucine-rich repeat domain-containing protein [Roseburia sp.]
MRKRVILFVVSCFAVLSFCVPSKAATQLGWDQCHIETYKQKEADYTVCYSYDDMECWIRQIKLHPKKADTSVLRIPGVIKGRTVTRIGSQSVEGGVKWFNVFGTSYTDDEDEGECFTPNTKSVKQIILPDSIDEILYLAFGGMENLEKINLPKNLKEVNKGIFRGCKKLKGVKIPAKTEKINFEAFSGCKSFEWIKVAKKNRNYKIKEGALLSKDGTKLYTWDKKRDYYKVPEGVKTIKEEANCFYTLKNVYLSSSVSKIERAALNCGTSEALEVRLSNKNKNYAKAGKCIYEKKTGKLVVAFTEKGILKIPNKVTKLTADISWRGGTTHKIMIPSSVKDLGQNWVWGIYSAERQTIQFEGTKPPEPIGKYPNTCLPGQCDYLVPDKSYKQYRKLMEKTENIGVGSKLNGRVLD